MKVLGKIFMFLAVCILMLHTVIPHDHHEDMSEFTRTHVIEHESATSWFDYINLAFHFSPAKNHLEDFEKSNQNFSFDFHASYQLLDFKNIVENVLENEWHIADDSRELRSPYVILPRFRGPPRIS